MRFYLKRQRESLHFTQIELSKKLGISESYYNLIENGNRQQNMTLDLLEKLALAFNVPVAELMEQESRYSKGEATS